MHIDFILDRPTLISKFTHYCRWGVSRIFLHWMIFCSSGVRLFRAVRISSLWMISEVARETSSFMALGQGGDSPRTRGWWCHAAVATPQVKGVAHGDTTDAHPGRARGDHARPLPGRGVGQIARRLSRGHSVVSRELRRNASKRGYRTNTTHKRARGRHARPQQRHVDNGPVIRERVLGDLGRGHAPPKERGPVEAGGRRCQCGTHGRLDLRR